jgi:uncharacterized protein YbaR (Trm112 family)
LSSQPPPQPLPDPEFISILRCPLSRAPLVLEGDRLLCYESRKAYRIEDGFPVLLIEEAEEIPEDRIPPEHRRKPK